MPQRNLRLTFYGPLHPAKSSFSHLRLAPCPPGALYGDEAGHGTHVAGSVAGAQLPYNPARHDAATGAAPSARLSFVDGGSPTRFDLPKPLAENYFPVRAGDALVYW